MQPRFPRTIHLCLVAASCAVVSPQSLAELFKDPPSTVSSTTRHNGLSQNRFAIVRTPSLIGIDKSKPVAQDAREAIRRYDRVLELDAPPDLRAEAMRRSADIRLQLAEGSERLDEAEVHLAVARYQQLLDEQPGYRLNDQVLYQLARAEQMLGDSQKSLAALRTLGSRYPGSPLSGDAHFRAGEDLYQEARYADAASEFGAIIAAGPSGEFFEPAQYRLGWSLYQQGRYEDALPPFLAILDKTLPTGTPADARKALADVPSSEADMATDVLRMTGLAFAALGGGAALNQYFEAHGEPRFSKVLYESLGSQLLDKHRYSDAAATYAAFIDRHPGDELAPVYQSRVLQAYREGGFNQLVVREEGRYAETYAPGSSYWSSRPANPEILAEVHKDLSELGPYFQARAQENKDNQSAARKEDFLAGAGWYRKEMELLPPSPERAAINLHLADCLYDAGRTREAADEYLKTAYEDGSHPKAAEAAFAVVQALDRLAGEVSPADRSTILRESVDADLRLAAAFPDAPQATMVLAQAAGDQFDGKDLDSAVETAKRVLSRPSPLDMRTRMLGIIADARLAQKQYPEAERAYASLLDTLPPGSALFQSASEQLAVAIYRQGEAARAAGDPKRAAAEFLRVGQKVPQASFRANADYDAGMAFMAIPDWGEAETVLEGFRGRFPRHALLADVDKKLALAYESDAKPAQAAAVYERLAHGNDSVESRRTAAWLAAQSFEHAHQPEQAVRTYEAYVAAFAEPLDVATEARCRLADLTRDDLPRHRYWLQAIIKSDTDAGPRRTDRTKLAAAKATYEVGHVDAVRARELNLVQPLAKSLAARKQAIESAVGELDRAAGYGYAEVTTAATYEIGEVYHDLSLALLQSERPSALNGEALAQYNLLLEEQADPFDEKAIEAHETNLKRFGQGVWNDWVRESAQELAALEPAKYGKREQRDKTYDLPQ